jgi:hypothetical protein
MARACCTDVAVSATASRACSSVESWRASAGASFDRLGPGQSVGANELIEARLCSGSFATTACCRNHPLGKLDKPSSCAHGSSRVGN